MSYRGIYVLVMASSELLLTGVVSWRRSKEMVSVSQVFPDHVRFPPRTRVFYGVRSVRAVVPLPPPEL